MQLQLHLERAFFRPGEPAQVKVSLSGPAPAGARMVARITHLERTLVEFSLEPLPQQTIAWQPPEDAPRGYGIDVYLLAADGETLAAVSSGFDVLAHWTERPRYGFLCDFAPERAGLDAIIERLAQYGVNGLQFYDWMYRHEQFLCAEDPYLDICGRRLSRRTVEAALAAAHSRGMAAMPYSAVYGASIAFLRQHPDWALLDQQGKAVLFGEEFMALMNPRPGSPWTAHLLAEFDRVLAETDFDGIHLDQYGEPRQGYTADGEAFDLAGPLVSLINETAVRVQARRGREGAVVFNCVSNWPTPQAAPSAEDLVYIELWPPDVHYRDVARILLEAQAHGGGKPVVLAAYLDPAHEAAVLRLDSLIFAHGGGHIELGEGNGALPGLLADPYFPNWGTPATELAEALQRLYRFAIRYGDVTGPGTKPPAPGAAPQVTLSHPEVWPVLRQAPGRLALSLVHLPGGGEGEWAAPTPHPAGPLPAQTVTLEGLAPGVRNAWYASPDGPGMEARPLAFVQEGERLTFTAPPLQYWNLIVLEWKT